MSFKILHQNIQCLRNKTLDIELFLNTLNTLPDLICLTEHWLREEEVDAVVLNHFNMMSCYSRKNMMHGGSCILIREDLQDFCEVEEVRLCSIEGQLEVSCVANKKVRMLVLSIYRTCLGSFNVFIQQLEAILNVVSVKFLDFKIVICGDFNVNFMLEGSNRSEFMDVLYNFDFEQRIFQPTRVTKSTASLLDNIFTNFDQFYDNEVIFSGLSDHTAQCIAFNVVMAERGAERVQKRIFSNSKCEQYFQSLQDCAWHDVLTESDVNRAYTTFIDALKIGIDMVFPLKNCKANDHSRSWITNGIKISSKNKRKLFQDYLLGVVSEQHYRAYSKILKSVIHKAKILHNHSIITNSENKSKATWSLIKKLTNKNTRSISVFNSFPNDDEHALLNDFNDFFISACPVINKNKTIQFPSIEMCHESIFLEPALEQEVFNYIVNLKDKKSVGYDEVPVKLIKTVAVLITAPLTHIINLVFSNGEYPDLLKVALVRPIHKKNAKDLFNNYRPVSLLSNIGKIFEKILFDRLIRFIEAHHILVKQQNGFRKGRSTSTAIFEALKTINETLNGKKVTATLCLDLSRAFDSVDHEILLKKMDRYGIRGIPLQLFKSYLSNRTQRVIDINERGERVVSNDRLIQRGVPQGSILGPLLYLIYTNDVVNVTNNRIVLFADDTSVLFWADDLEGCKRDIEVTLKNLNNWFTSNNLLLNINKTKLLVFGPRREQELGIKLGKDEIESTESLSFLGVNLDRQLDWRTHVSLLAGSMARYCYAISVIANNINVSAALSAYHAFVQSRVRYGVMFWGNSVDSGRIFKLQKKCLRTIFKIKQLESCRDAFINNNILTLYSLYIYECVMFAIRNSSILTDFQHDHIYNTRNKDLLYTTRANFSYLQKNIVYMLLKIWNLLPTSFKTLTVGRQKLKLKKFLIKKCYYTVSEFLEEKDFRDL